MLSGAHIIIFSADPDADRAFLRDVLKLLTVVRSRNKIGDC